ncbi:hypothetical protein U1Q18_031959, partial [Sarracenia purpurea var. burkii]
GRGEGMTMVVGEGRERSGLWQVREGDAVCLGTGEGVAADGRGHGCNAWEDDNGRRHFPRKKKGWVLLG